ncbi:MAG: class I tRNA ligase family protein [Candidatus Magasanikbacteria bacterium]|nr:class I tRNA ligase family protein [Candidatus Magasanikbacteria bacterium]
MYIMFMGPFDQPVAWDTNGVKGVKRFLEKVWAIQNNNKFDREGEDGWIFDDQLKLVHKLIRKITTDIDEMKFNTAIAKMMEFINEISSNSVISRGVWKIFLKLLSPFAPHIADELWNSEPFFENNGSLASEKWPIVDEKNLYEERMTIVIQVNGKVRARQQVGTNLDEEIIKRNALSDDRVQKWLEGKAPKKIIYVKGRLVSIVV